MRSTIGFCFKFPYNWGQKPATDRHETERKQSSATSSFWCKAWLVLSSTGHGQSLTVFSQSQKRTLCNHARKITLPSGYTMQQSHTHCFNALSIMELGLQRQEMAPKNYFTSIFSRWWSLKLRTDIWPAADRAHITASLKPQAHRKSLAKCCCCSTSSAALNDGSRVFDERSTQHTECKRKRVPTWWSIRWCKQFCQTSMKNRYKYNSHDGKISMAKNAQAWGKISVANIVLVSLARTYCLYLSMSKQINRGPLKPPNLCFGLLPGTPS